MKNLTVEYKVGKTKALDNKLATDPGSNVRVITDKALTKLKALESKIRDHEAALQDLADKLKDDDYAEGEERYIVSYKYNKWHLTFPWRNIDSKSWKTPCGWSYGSSVIERQRDMPDDLQRKWMCPRCCPKKALSDSDAS